MGLLIRNLFFLIPLLLIYSCTNSQKPKTEPEVKALIGSLNKQLLNEFGGSSRNTIIKAQILDIYNSSCDMGFDLGKMVKERYGISTLNYFKDSIATKTFYFEVARFYSLDEASLVIKKLKEQANQLKSLERSQMKSHCVDPIEFRLNDVFIKGDYILIVNHTGYSSGESEKIIKYLSNEFSRLVG